MRVLVAPPAPAPAKEAGSPARVALLLVMLLAALTPAAAAAAPPISPPDFTITAVAGAVSPAYPIREVVLNPDGSGSYCRTDPADRQTGSCTVTTSFNLTVDDMNTLWTAIQSNGFSSLSPYYLDPTVADGSFADLTVTANGVTQEVITQNTPTAPFDAIMVTLNSLLPSGVVLKYNAIAP